MTKEELMQEIQNIINEVEGADSGATDILYGVKNLDDILQRKFVSEIATLSIKNKERIEVVLTGLEDLLQSVEAWEVE